MTNKNTIATDLLRHLRKPSKVIIDKNEVIKVDNSVATREIKEKNIWKFICGIK